MSNTEAMGEKIIAYKQKEMSAIADKIKAKGERVGTWVYGRD